MPLLIIYSSGISRSPDLICARMSIGASPLTVQPTENAVPSISNTVPSSLFAIERGPAGGGAASPGVDRYEIRTRNLQDWNLTRYRCANRSLDECASGGVRTHASGEIGA